MLSKAVFFSGDRIMDARKFYSDKHRFSLMLSGTKKRHYMGEDYPILNEDEKQDFDHHYIYHTAWAAQILARTKPRRHVDIGSSLYFAGIVSAFIPMEHYDYRKPDLTLDGLTVGHADLMALPFQDNSVESLSCMHVVEHCGLGRYGDPLDPDGDLKAMEELSRVLAPGGQLLFVAPIGIPAIWFNAHRVYTEGQIIDAFDGLYLKIGAEPTPGCGCFCFGKAAA
jgi:SAM-dependent methyltransferase